MWNTTEAPENVFFLQYKPVSYEGCFLQHNGQNSHNIKILYIVKV